MIALFEKKKGLNSHIRNETIRYRAFEILEKIAETLFPISISLVHGHLFCGEYRSIEAF